MSWCFAFISLPSVKGLYEKRKSSALKKKLGSESKWAQRYFTHLTHKHTHTHQWTVHPTVFLETRERERRGWGVGGVREVLRVLEHTALSGCGGVGGQIRAVSHIKLLAGPERFRGGMLEPNDPAPAPNPAT